MLAIVTSLLLANSAPGAVPAKELAPAIIAIAVSNKIDPILLTKIVLVESGGVADAYNKTTQDYGIAQINEQTRKAYGFSRACMLVWRCNLNAAARILADMWRIKGARSCMYNGGPKFRKPEYEKPCVIYETKLAYIN